MYNSRVDTGISPAQIPLINLHVMYYSVFAQILATTSFNLCASPDPDASDGLFVQPRYFISYGSCVVTFKSK